MHNIFLMAGAATFVAVALIGGFVYKRVSLRDRQWILVAAVFGFFGYFFSYYLRGPLDVFILELVPSGSSAYAFFGSLYAPLADESVKVLVAVLPFIYGKIDRRNFHLFALSIGLGFGVAEIWSLAFLLSTDASILALPWYMLTGFFSERVVVCFLHGAFLLAVLQLLLADKLRGVGAAMFMHWIFVAPQMASLEIGLSENYFVEMVLTQWIFVYGFLMLVLAKRIVDEGKGMPNTIYPQ